MIGWTHRPRSLPERFCGSAPSSLMGTGLARSFRLSGPPETRARLVAPAHPVRPVLPGLRATKVSRGLRVIRVLPGCRACKAPKVTKVFPAHQAQTGNPPTRISPTRILLPARDSHRHPAPKLILASMWTRSRRTPLIRPSTNGPCSRVLMVLLGPRALRAWMGEPRIFIRRGPIRMLLARSLIFRQLRLGPALIWGPTPTTQRPTRALLPHCGCGRKSKAHKESGARMVRPERRATLALRVSPSQR